jgi:hypothetical protein
MMKFTFGIITTDPKAANSVIDSIKNQNIDTDSYEVIVVGGENKYDNVNHIEFDEGNKGGWITKKKNIITENAKYENVVYMHDYIHLRDGWYDGFVGFGNDWDVAMNVVWNANDLRFRDWVFWDHPEVCYSNGEHGCVLAPYSHTDTQYMYISGAYWVAKKKFMQDNPLDENLYWGQSEDVEWSKKARKTWNYRMNIRSSVISTKYKGHTAGAILLGANNQQPYRPLLDLV